jgi:hypothetical protein
MIPYRAVVTAGFAVALDFTGLTPTCTLEQVISLLLAAQANGSLAYVEPYGGHVADNYMCALPAGVMHLGFTVRVS